jgi:hypothetical protein
MPHRRLPHRRRFEQVELEIVWAATETLDVAMKRVLLRELATELAQEGFIAARKNPRDRVSRAVISLHTAADLLGDPPSLLQYRQLRVSFPDLQLMSDGAIRRALGRESWNDCLARALIPASTTTIDFISPGQGEEFTLEELISALHQYVAEHDRLVPTVAQFVAWARDPKIQALPGRRPLTAGPFQRFGGYPAVLREAGLLDDVRRSSIGRVIAISHAYSKDELLSAVRRVAIELGRRPRQVEYVEVREAGIAALEASPTPDGASGILPSVVVLKKRWGAWPNVIAAAGLPPLPTDRHPRARRHLRRPVYTRDQLLEAVRRAWVACGDPLTRDAYSTWRDRERRAAELRGEHVEIPSLDAFDRHFRGWTAAVAAALPNNGD